MYIHKDYRHYLRDKVLERVHDLGALGLLIVRETSSDHHDSREYNPQIQLQRTMEERLGILLKQCDLKRLSLKKQTGFTPYVIIGRFLLVDCLDAVGKKTKDGSNPQESWESSKELLAELDPFWGCWRRCQSVGSITRQDLLSTSAWQSLEKVMG